MFFKIILIIFFTTIGLLHSDNIMLSEEGVVAQIYFAPTKKEEITSAIIDKISNAKREILIQAYAFTSQKIKNALLNALKRDINLIILLDPSNKNNKNSIAQDLLKNGANILIDNDHKIAHNKIIIIDKSITITGSFNFSKSAENNAENIVILYNKDASAVYYKNFLNHLSHSELLK